MSRRASKGKLISGVYTLFADDVRPEASGQDTIVGLYSDDVRPLKYPYLLPKLALFNRVLFKEGVECPSEIKMIIENTDGTTHEQDLALDMPKAPNNYSAQAQLVLILTPYIVPKPGRLITKINISGDEYVTGALDFLEVEAES